MRTIGRKYFWVLALFCIAVGGGLYWWTSPRYEPLQCSLSPGERWVYRWDETTGVILDPAALLPSDQRASAPPSQSQLISVDGYLQMHVVAVTDLATVEARFLELNYSSNGDSLLDQQIAQYHQGVQFKLGSDCMMVQIAVPTNYASNVQRNWVNWLQALEYKVGAQSREDRWEAFHHDQTGTYLAAYLRQGNAIVREKIEYKSVKTPNASATLEAKIELSDAQIAHGAQWFDQHILLETVELRSDQGLFARVNVRRRLERDDQYTRAKPKTPAAPTAVAQWQNPAQFKATETLEEREPWLRKVSVDDVRDIPLDEFMKRFYVIAQEVDGGGPRFQEAAALLVRYLQADPDHPAEIMAMMIRDEIPQKLRSFVFFAYEKAGGAQVQAVLYDAAYSDQLPTANRMQAVSALQDISDPNAQVADHLLGLSRGNLDDDQYNDVANTALLGVGKLAGRAQLDQIDRKRLKAEVRDRYDRAETVEDMTTALAAMDNSQDPEFFNVLVEASANDSPFVRSTALRGLAHNKTRPSADFWIEAASGEPQPRVADEIAEAVASDPESSLNQEQVDQIAHNIESDLIAEDQSDKEDPRDARARRKVWYRMLGVQAQKGNEQAKSTLINAYRQESSGELLEIIGEYLSAVELARASRK